MNPKWIVGLGMLFIVLSIFNGIIEQSYIGSGKTNVFYTLLSSYSEASFSNPLIAIGSIVNVVWGTIQTVWAMFIFDYAQFEGSWQIVRFAFFLPISVALVVSLILSAVRGVSSG